MTRDLPSLGRWFPTCSLFGNGGPTADGLCFRTCNSLLPKNTLCSFQEALFREGMTQPHSTPPTIARCYVGPHAMRCSNPAFHPRSATAMFVPYVGTCRLENRVHRLFSVAIKRSYRH